MLTTPCTAAVGVAARTSRPEITTVYLSVGTGAASKPGALAVTKVMPCSN
jgi:hypothetical protein